MRLRRKRSSTLISGRRATTYSQTKTPVFSYYKGQRGTQADSNNPSRTQPVRDQSRFGVPDHRRHRFQLKHIPTYIALCMLGGALLYTLSLSASPRVVIEQAPGVVQRDVSTYRADIQALWRTSPFNRTKVTINAQRTRQAILDNYHELSDVRIQLPLVGHRATIVLVPAAPSLQIQAENGRFYLDADGKALADTSHVTTSNSVPTVQDESVLAVDPGQPVLPQSQVLFILQLFTELDAAHVPVKSITLSDQAVSQIDFRTPDHTYYVKFQADGSVDVRQAVGTYLAVRKKFQAEGIKPGEYLDLRVSEKAFYR